MDFEQFIPFQPGEILLHAGNGEILLEDILSEEESGNLEGREHCQIRDWHYVTLHFDFGEGAIGIKPVNKPSKRDPAVYRVIKEDERSVKISCPSFLWFYGIAFGDQIYKYRASWDKEQGMLIAKE